MKEDFLHLLWKLKKLSFKDLKTLNGESLEIIKFGNHNRDAGPDFLNAEIKIGNQKWIGHIEFHLDSKDWTTHGHQNDGAYNNVILHVVHTYSSPALNSNKQELPTLEIKDRIDPKLIDQYDTLTQNLNWIPCADSISKTDADKNRMFLDRVLTERLEEKCDRIRTSLHETKNDWEQVLYQMILRYLGLKINGDAFFQLSQKAPYSLIHKVHSSLKQTEALLFGQAGFLSDPKDDYLNALAKEYAHLKNKFQLNPMTGLEWKFAKLRPANFPSIRLAQVAQIYHKRPTLFQEVIHHTDLASLGSIFKVQASSYWDSHYVPGKESEPQPKKIGQQALNNLLINAIVPLIFSYGIIIQDSRYKDKAIDLLLKIPKEDNSVIKKWKDLGFAVKSAFETQALLQLKSQYCDQFRCLNCNIGQRILFA